MRSDEGTYALFLRSPTRSERHVGALGKMTIRAGVYVYVGSAFGPGGVRARVQRHARSDGSPHWHIDYLRPHTSLEVAWYTHDDTPRECAWATVFREDPRTSVPLHGFGASDCDCATHLLLYEQRPALDWFRMRVRARAQNHGPIEKIDGPVVAE